MPATLDYPHILKRPGEVACLESHPRTRVSMIVTDYVGRGWSVEEIARQYPYLTLAEIHAALAFYHDHQDEIDRELSEEMADADRARDLQPTTPLLTRLRALRRPPVA